MNKIKIILLTVVFTGINSTINSYWQCPGTTQKHHTLAAAQQQCAYPIQVQTKTREAKDTLSTSVEYSSVNAPKTSTKAR